MGNSAPVVNILALCPLDSSLDESGLGVNGKLTKFGNIKALFKLATDMSIKRLRY